MDYIKIVNEQDELLSISLEPEGEVIELKPQEFIEVVSLKEKILSPNEKMDFEIQIGKDNVGNCISIWPGKYRYSVSLSGKNFLSRKIRTVSNIISLGLILYLIGATFLEVEFAEVKNNHLTAIRKAEIDTIQDIAIVKDRAKKDLDTIRMIHKNYSVKSGNNLFVLFVLLIIQAFLLLPGKTPDENKVSSNS